MTPDAEALTTLTRALSNESRSVKKDRIAYVNALVDEAGINATVFHHFAEVIEGVGLLRRHQPGTEGVVYVCAFCGKDQQKVLKLISAPGVSICNGCVAICQDLLDADAKLRADGVVGASTEVDVYLAALSRELIRSSRSHPR